MISTHDAKRFARQALTCHEVQPCNLAGLIHSIAERRAFLLQQPGWREIGSAFVNGDPVLRILLDAALIISSGAITYDEALGRVRADAE